MTPKRTKRSRNLSNGGGDPCRDDIIVLYTEQQHRDAMDDLIHEHAAGVALFEASYDSECAEKLAVLDAVTQLLGNKNAPGAAAFHWCDACGKVSSVKGPRGVSNHCPLCNKIVPCRAWCTDSGHYARCAALHYALDKKAKHKK